MPPALSFAGLLVLTLERRLELEYSKTPGVHDIIVSLNYTTFPGAIEKLVRWLADLRLPSAMPCLR